jgi:hypothetical protein
VPTRADPGTHTARPQTASTPGTASGDRTKPRATSDHALICGQSPAPSAWTIMAAAMGVVVLGGDIGFTAAVGQPRDKGGSAGLRGEPSGLGGGGEQPGRVVRGMVPAAVMEPPPFAPDRCSESVYPRRPMSYTLGSGGNVHTTLGGAAGSFLASRLTARGWGGWGGRCRQRPGTRVAVIATAGLPRGRCLCVSARRAFARCGRRGSRRCGGKAAAGRRSRGWTCPRPRARRPCSRSA